RKGDTDWIAEVSRKIDVFDHDRAAWPNSATDLFQGLVRPRQVGQQEAGVCEIVARIHAQIGRAADLEFGGQLAQLSFSSRRLDEGSVEIDAGRLALPSDPAGQLERYLADAAADIEARHPFGEAHPAQKGVGRWPLDASQQAEPFGAGIVASQNILIHG